MKISRDNKRSNLGIFTYHIINNFFALAHVLVAVVLKPFFSNHVFSIVEKVISSSMIRMDGIIGSY